MRKRKPTQTNCPEGTVGKEFELTLVAGSAAAVFAEHVLGELAARRLARRVCGACQCR